MTKAAFLSFSLTFSNFGMFPTGGGGRAHFFQEFFSYLYAAAGKAECLWRVYTYVHVYVS